MRRIMNGESVAFCCYGCCIAYQVRHGSSEEWDAAWLLIRLGVGGFLSMNIMLFSLLLYAGAFVGDDARLIPSIQLLLWALATPAVLILGAPFVREAWSNIGERRLTSASLIVLGVGAAYLDSTFSALVHRPYVYFDTATMVLLLFTLGRYLEAVGRARAARDLSPLLAAESELARVVEGEMERRLPIRSVSAGMLVRVWPGERIPVDGVVVEGQSHIDERVLSGESRLISKSPGTGVMAGSINLEATLLVRSSCNGSETRWAQICRSVRDALAGRSAIQRVGDHAIGLFVPLVLGLAIITFVYWTERLPYDRALLIGLAVLVVACPCAVGLAAPLATSLGIGRLARHGCLVRDPGALEALSRSRIIAFDKTGTLTSGSMRLVAIECDGVGTDEVLARTAGLERSSQHAAAQAVVDATAKRGVQPIAAAEVRAIPGRGIRGSAGGEPVAAGNDALMRELGWKLPRVLADRARRLEANGYSLVLVGWSGRVHAVLALDDTPLPEARSMVETLRGLGLDVRLLTGDLAGPAQRIAAELGIEYWQAGLAPEEKKAALHRWHAGHHGLVAMVGDGLNDGPVLAAAEVGLAVSSGTDLARQTADILLPLDGLWMLPWIVRFARMVRRTIVTNLLWALGYNLIALTVAALGLLQPVLAAAIMAGSSLLVVGNSLRLERFPEPPRDPAFVAPRALS